MRRGAEPAGPESEEPQGAAFSAASRPLRRIDDPSCTILVVSLADEPWAGAEAELLGAARRAADDAGGAVLLLRLDRNGRSSDPGRAGADRLLAMPSPSGLPDAQAEVVLCVMASFDTPHALFGDAGQDGDVGRRVAASLGERPAVAVQRIQDGSVISRGAGGVDFHRLAPRIILLAQGAGDPFDGPALHEARPVAAPLLQAAAEGLVRDLGPELLSVADLPLGEADFIVSAGDGVTDWPAFYDVADALSGTIGGSRQVCDAGLLPRSRQVGASGTLVEAKCYLAFGISGAPQHLQGIQRCRLVAAVNTDLHAAMVKRADIAIIADAQDVMPALAAVARAKRHAR